MSMKTPRNAPCPCGSGKKYKRCRLPSDEAAERKLQKGSKTKKSDPAQLSISEDQELIKGEQFALEERHEGSDIFNDMGTQDNAELFGDDEDTRADDGTLDPLDQERQAFWDQLIDVTDTDAGRKADLLEHAIARPGFLVDDLAFNAFDHMYDASTQNDQRDRFAMLVEQFRQAEPEEYRKQAKWLIEWRLTNALAQQQDTAIWSLVREYGQIEHKDVDIDHLFRIAHLLAYYGQAGAMAQLVSDTLPYVWRSNNVIGGADDRFADLGVDGLISDRLQRGLPLDVDQGEFMAQVRTYLPDGDPAVLGARIARLTGPTVTLWTPVDFDPVTLATRKNRKAKVQALASVASNTMNFSLEFAGTLIRENTMPHSRSLLAARTLNDYLRRRADGSLSARVDVFSGQTTRVKSTGVKHPLLPDHDTLDRYLAGLMSVWNLQFHQAAALFEAIPTWIDFIERQRLANHDQAQVARADYQRLRESMLQLWLKMPHEPALHQNLAARP